jgi:hypothetical protein
MIEIPQSYNGKPLRASWTYRAEDGAPFGVVGRYQNGTDKKDIVPYFNKNGSGFTAGVSLNPRPLFGVEKLATHAKDKAFFVVEGEKSAAALQQLGICAVTSLGGSNAADKADWTPINGYKMAYLLPDNDDPGEHYAQEVCKALMALESPPSIKVLHLAGLPLGGDIVDWIQAFIAGWDGYAPLPENSIEALKEELRAELKSAEAVLHDWSLATLAPSHSSVFEWENPNKIETQIPPVQALPPELIPEPFRPWLADVSHRMQTPPDFAAISSVVTTSSIIGAGCGIRPKRLDDWEVIPNTWGACVGRPSVVLKTPSMKEPMSLLERLQAEYGRAFESAKAEVEFDSLTSKAMLDDIKGQLTKAAKGAGKDKVVNPDDIGKLKADFLELSQGAAAEPTRRLFKTNETSIQSMTLLQTQNPRGILTFRDELTALLVKWDREDGADERAYFLEGWNGNGSYTDMKIGRGLTDAKNICISLLGGIQPDKLKRYLYQAQNGANDGLVQRLQLAVWPDEPKDWQLIDTVPNRADKQRAFDIMKAFTGCSCLSLLHHHPFPNPYHLSLQVCHFGFINNGKFAL